MILLTVPLLVFIVLSLLVGSTTGLMAWRGHRRAGPIFWTCLVLFFTGAAILIAREASPWVALAPAIPATVIGAILLKAGRRP